MKKNNNKNSNIITLDFDYIESVGKYFDEIIDSRDIFIFKAAEINILESLYAEICEINVNINKIKLLLLYIHEAFPEDSRQFYITKKYIKSFDKIVGNDFYDKYATNYNY